MGAFLDKPKTEKHNQCGEGNGLRYGLGSMQGWRVEMEDAHTAVIGLPLGLTDWSFFAVFDGHAGARVSAYCAEQLLQAITLNEDFRSSVDAEPLPPTSEMVKKGIKKGFLSLDERMREMPEMMSGDDKSGSTAVCVLMSQNHIFFANCGDSRGVLSRAGKVQFSTQDHKPFHPLEKERICNAGGSVMIQRVNGSLAVSRALGDFEYKSVEGKGPCEQLVSPEPDVVVEDRTGDDEFLVLACDGIWDVMTNEELCDFIRNRMQLTDNIENVCNLVIDTCLYKGSRDNMSIVIVAFSGAPVVSEEAIAKEKELESRLEKKVQDIFDSPEASDIVLPYIMHRLSEEEIDGLPPGGGLFAKRPFIEQVYNKLKPKNSAENSEENC